MHNHLIQDPAYILRAFGGYFLTLIIVRIMGKRSIGELGPFDFVLMASIGDIMAFIVLERDTPFHQGAIILSTLAIIEIILSKVTLKNKKMAILIEGAPTKLIEDGKLIKKNMSKEKISYYDVKKELRNHGVTDESMVEVATIESCGKFTVVLKEEGDTVINKDFKSEFGKVKKDIEKLNKTLDNLIIEIRRIQDKE